MKKLLFFLASILLAFMFHKDTTAMEALMEQMSFMEEQMSLMDQGYRTLSQLSESFDGSKNYSLVLACLKGQEEQALALIEDGADINYTLPCGLTPIIATCVAENKELFLKLLDQGVDIHTPRLSAACQYYFGHELGKELVLILLDRGANVNDSMKTGHKPLAMALVHSDNDFALELINRGANVDIGSATSNSALGIAIPRCSKKVIFKLIDCGAHVRDIDLCYACERNHDTPEIVLKLIRHGANVNARETWSFHDLVSPLDLACESDNLNIVISLVENGATITQWNIDSTIAYTRINNYLQAAYDFQQAEDKIQYVTQSIQAAHPQTAHIIRLAFYRYIKSILDNQYDKELGASLALDVYQIAQENPKVKNAILQAFDITNEALLEKKHFNTFIDHIMASSAMKYRFAHYKHLRKDEQERRSFAFSQNSVKKLAIAIAGKKTPIIASTLFFNF